MDHPEWQQELSQKKKQNTLSFAKTNKKGINVHSWMELIVMGHHPYSFCENEYVKKYINLAPISVDTLTTYIDKTVYRVEQKIANILPEKFIIISDGWSINSTHYVRIFAHFFDKQSNESVTPSLAISPLQDEENLSASSHYEIIVSVLDVFKKTKTSIIAYVADNENLNVAISKLLKVPMIGCASHR